MLVPIFASGVSAAPLEDPTQTQKTLSSRYPSPAAWDAALFFPVQQPAFAPTLTENAPLDVNLPGLSKPARLSVTGATVETDWGLATAVVKLRLDAESAGIPVSAQVTVNAKLVFDTFSQGANGTGLVHFNVDLEAGASATWSGDSFGGIDLSSEIKKRNIFPALGKKIVFSFPIPTDFSRRFGINEEVVLAAGHEGWVKVRVTVPNSELRLKIAQVAPVFVPSGIWLCVRYEGTAESPPGTLPGTLQDALAAYENEAAQTGRLLVNASLVENLMNDLGARPETLRTATIKMIDHDGKLFDSGGDVSVQIWPENNNASASLVIKPTAFSREGESYVGCAYQANAKADLHIHMDPGPTGGFGMSVGANGDTAGWIETKIDLKVLEKDGAKTLMLVPQFDAGQELVAELRTDGRAKTKIAGQMISCSIPSTGARITFPVPLDVVPPLILLSNKPIALKPLAAAAGNFTMPTAYAVVTPLTATRDVSGWRIDFGVSLKTLTEQEAATTTKTVAALEDSYMHPDLSIGKIEMLVGPWAIGPNNDLVKAVLAMIRAGENVAREAERAGKNIEREAKRGADNVSSTTRIAVIDTGRELRTLRTNITRESTAAGQILYRTPQSALEAAGKGEKWLERHAIPRPHINLPGGIRIR